MTRPTPSITGQQFIHTGLAMATMPLSMSSCAPIGSRGSYDGLPVAVSDLKELASAGSGNGVGVFLFDSHTDIETILQLVIDGNTDQLDDAAFVRELKQWIRFSSGEAVEKRDGLYALSSGNPSVPRWLGSPMFDMLFNAKSENDKYAKQVRSSAGIAILCRKLMTKPIGLRPSVAMNASRYKPAYSAFATRCSTRRLKTPSSGKSWPPRVCASTQRLASICRQRL